MHLFLGHAVDISAVARKKNQQRLRRTVGIVDPVAVLHRIRRRAVYHLRSLRQERTCEEQKKYGSKQTRTLTHGAP
jgi:hypothetical protein